MVYQYLICGADFMVMLLNIYVDHLLSGCLSIATTVYKQRHDCVAKIIHWVLDGLALLF